MTLDVSSALLPFLGVYVTLNARCAIVREQVGFESADEFHVWRLAMREKYPQANFALFAVGPCELVWR
jgi:hypothetical protein